MKTEDQNKSLALHDGFTEKRETGEWMGDSYEYTEFYKYDPKTGHKEIGGFYDQSYDNIMPVIANQKIAIKEHIRHLLKDRMGIHCFSATPAQLLEATVRALGLWK